MATPVKLLDEKLFVRIWPSRVNSGMFHPSGNKGFLGVNVHGSH